MVLLSLIFYVARYDGDYILIEIGKASLQMLDMVRDLPFGRSYTKNDADQVEHSKDEIIRSIQGSYPAVDQVEIDQNA